MSDSADRYNRSTDDDLTLYATLTLEPRRLVFAPEERAIARDERELAKEMEKLKRFVIDIYFERKQLRKMQNSEGFNVSRSIEIEKRTTLLNELTGGGFR